MREAINLARKEMKNHGLENEIEKLEGKGGFFDTYWTNSIDDAKYIENDEYKVIGLKTDDHTWVKGSGGVGWSSELVLLYLGKEFQEIKKVKTPEIKTRDRHSANLDKKHLWGFNQIGLEFIEKDKVKAYWMNNAGEKGPTYEIKLE